MRFAFSPLALFLVQILVAAPALAQAPEILSYQGRLLKSDGTPEVGSVTMRFALFRTATGGTAVWSEDKSVGLIDGFFAAYLGDASAPGALASAIDSSALWLELSVGGEAMTPRQRLASAPYALTCSSALNLKGGSVDAASIAVKGTTVIDSSGKWVGPPTGLAGPQGQQGPQGPAGVPCAGCVDTPSIKDAAITGAKIAPGTIAAANIQKGALALVPSMTVRQVVVKTGVVVLIGTATAQCNSDEIYIGGMCDVDPKAPSLQVRRSFPAAGSNDGQVCWFTDNNSASADNQGYAIALCAKMGSVSVP